MLLKKQTVWLLTMLSLIVVLSVYYVMQDPDQSADVAMDQKENKQLEEEAAVEGQNDETITEHVGDDAFEAMRLEISDERSKMKSDLTDQVASSELSTKEKMEVYDKIQNLQETAMKERLLEKMIVALGYEDALVRADGSKVRISVKTVEKEHDKAAANDIIRLVQDEIGDMQVGTVEFQASAKQ